MKEIKELLRDFKKSECITKLWNVKLGYSERFESKMTVWPQMMMWTTMWQRATPNDVILHQVALKDIH